MISSLVAQAKEFCPEVEFAAEDAARSEIDFLTAAMEAAISAGATMITICDTAGTMMPDEFKTFIEDSTTACPLFHRLYFPYNVQMR